MYKRKASLRASLYLVVFTQAQEEWPRPESIPHETPVALDKKLQQYLAKSFILLKHYFEVALSYDIRSQTPVSFCFKT